MLDELQGSVSNAQGSEGAANVQGFHGFHMLFSSVPMKIVAYFRLTYFRRLFSSVCRRK
jgi:hypothetical protein